VPPEGGGLKKMKVRFAWVSKRCYLVERSILERDEAVPGDLESALVRDGFRILKMPRKWRGIDAVYVWAPDGFRAKAGYVDLG